MTDAIAYYAILTPSVEANARRGGSRLVVRCSQNKTEVYFDLSHAIDWSRNDDYGRYRLKVRLDDDDPGTRMLSEAAGLNRSYFVPRGWEFAKQLTGHDRLRIQYTRALGGGTHVVEFALTGHETALHTIRKECGW